MTKEEIKILIDSSKERMKRTPSKEEAISTFVRIGVLDKSGKLTDSYKELEKYLVTK